MYVNQFEEPTYPRHDMEEEIGEDVDGLERMAKAILAANFEAAEYESELQKIENELELN